MFGICRTVGRRVDISLHALCFVKQDVSSRTIRWGSESHNHHHHQHHVNSATMAHMVNGNLERCDNVHDVAIIGGGVVGVALACALSYMPLTKHLSIAIVDSSPLLGFEQALKKSTVPDSRVSTVTPATITFLEDIGAWNYVRQQRHAFFEKMQIWDYTGFGYTRYNARDISKDVLGCVVENKVLHWSLMSSLQKKLEFAKKIYHARLMNMKLPSQSSCTGQISRKNSLGHLAELNLSNGDTIYTKLVVGADGSKSQVREIAGFTKTSWRYPQNAITCTVEHTIENQCAWQRFLPAGPIALLPVGDRFSNIVWTMNPGQASDHASKNKADFIKSVNHALNYGYGPHPKSGFIGEFGGPLSWFTRGLPVSAYESFEAPPIVVDVLSERMAFPLSFAHAKQYVAPRVALIGDAAHTVHPLAGQGVNLGFGDAFALSNSIAEAISVGTDIGELSVLKKYEDEKKLPNATMMAILDGFQKAFSFDFGPTNLLRAAAFHGAQYIGPLKRSIISYAAGEQTWPLFF